MKSLNLLLYSFIILLNFSCQPTEKDHLTITQHEIDSLGYNFNQILNKDITLAKRTSNLITKKSNTIQYQKGIALGLITNSIILNQEGKYDSAVASSLNALSIRKKILDTVGQISCFITLANSYNLLKQRDKQHRYLLSAIKLAQKVKDKNVALNTTTDLAIYYSSIEQFDSARILFQQCLNIARQLNDSIQIAYAMENYGNILNQIEEVDSALLFYNKSLHIYHQHGMKVQRARIYNNIAMIYWNSNKRDSVRHYLEKGFIETKILNSTTDLEKYLINIIDFWEEEPNLAKSNLYLHELVTLKDTVFNKNLATKLAGIEKSFEVKLQQEENAKLKAEVSRKNIIRNSAILLAILTIVLAVYRIRIYKQKQNLALQQQQLKENEIDQLLQERELKNMDALLEGRETERKRIGQDLHDRLGSILSTVKLHFSAIEDRIDNLKKDNLIQYQKASELLDEAVGEVRKIAQDLVSGVLAKYGLVAALNDMKNSLEATGKIKINIFEAGLEGRNNPEFEIGIYRIVQELMSNILKHSEAGKVDIHLTKDENEFTLIVEDNGKGFNPNQPEKFGLGMANIKQRVAALGGEVTFDSKPGNGATVIIEVPVLTENLDS